MLNPYMRRSASLTPRRRLLPASRPSVPHIHDVSLALRIDIYVRTPVRKGLVFFLLGWKGAGFQELGNTGLPGDGEMGKRAA